MIEIGSVAELIQRSVPEVLRGKGPAGLEYWQWLGAFVGLLTAWGVGWVLGFVTRKVLGRIASRTGFAWDDELARGLSSPLTMAWTVLAARAVRLSLGLPKVANERWLLFERIGFMLAAFWGLWCLITVGKRAVQASTWAAAMPSSRSLIVLGARMAKAAVAVLALLTLLAMLGYPVTTLIAGLGVGGIAFALAAQKTVENLFGAFSLGVDQPFREGDFVRIDSVLGTVEAVGLRSTRVRTLDRTLVTIPNGKLAEMQIESYTVRDRIRLACIVGLEYGTRAEQLRSVLAGLRRVLSEHPKIWPDNVIVRFSKFAESSLDIEIMAWFQTSDWGEFQGIREEVLIAFMDVVEGAGCSFAFPTRTVHTIDSTPRDDGQRDDGSRKK